MKIKLLSLIFLALSFSLTACGVKVFKSSSASAESNAVDITRPPLIAVSEDDGAASIRDPDAAISYDEWLKKNALPSKTSE